MLRCNAAVPYRMSVYPPVRLHRPVQVVQLVTRREDLRTVGTGNLLRRSGGLGCFSFQASSRKSSVRWLMNASSLFKWWYKDQAKRAAVAVTASPK